MPEDRAASFLQLIRRSQRGRLKVYLGYGPGVGKTYQMLQEGQRLKGEGVDVVLGLVETHGRVDTAKLVEGLEQVLRRRVEYHGITIEEMDVDAILTRKPQVCLVDELAHTNVPGSRNDKRYQDVQEILAGGIHVITTLNVQHLESLYNTVEKLIGVKVRERLPDAVLAEADQVVNVDLAAEDLQKRLREGRIYPKERIAASLDNFFTASNLEHLRELTLRELASQLDFKRREVKTEENAKSLEQVMVCLSSRGPNSAKLLRYASRLAGRLNRNWYAVYVQTPREEPTVIDATTQRLLADTLTLANQLGAVVFTFKGQDVADTILRFASEYRVGQIVIGSPRPIPWWRRMVGAYSVAEQLIQKQRDVTIIVVDAEAAEESAPPGASSVPVTPVSSAPPPTGKRALATMLDPSRIVVVNDALAKRDVLRRLAQVIAPDAGTDATRLLDLLEERERQGSTFLNEGIALPHARVPALTVPHAALALTHGGVLDVPTARPIEAVFMLLSPAENAGTHLQALAVAGRAFQNRDLVRQLREARSAEQAFNVLRSFNNEQP